MNCVRCKILREQDMVCRACGYPYLSLPGEVISKAAPDAAPFGPLDAIREHESTAAADDAPYGPLDAIREYEPRGLFQTLMLLFMTGTNPTAVAVVGLVVMTSVLVGASFPLGAGWVAMFVGIAAVAFDLLARRMLRCSLADVRRGSQLFHLPVWVIGALTAVVVLVVKGTG